ncbi:MAG: T9SS type A sorting domain-containing protein [Flavobacteriales bacterium]|nr:T9SS type A sorting domain-containing protein [Flavobacteriales bacterium]
MAKYDTNGDLSWVTGSTGPGWKQASSIVVGGSGQVYITGQYNGNLTICTSILTGDLLNYYAFLSCLDTAGALLWQQELPATAGSYGASLAARPAGDIVLTGGFSGSMTVGSTTLTGVGGQDAWVASFNSAGENLWAQAMTGADPIWDVAAGAAVAADDQNVYVVGSFGDIYFTAFDQTGGTCAFDGDPGSVRFAPNSGDAFIVKYGSVENISPPYNPLGCDGTVQIEEARSPVIDLMIAPNPVAHSFTLTSTAAFDARTRVVVHDALGREVTVPFNVRGSSIEVDASALTPGAYTITLFTSAGTLTRHFAKH